MRLFLLLIIVLAVRSLFGFSLFSMDKDPYSASAGERVYALGGRAAGMGGAGAALADSLNYHDLNPASYAQLDYTLITTTYAPEFTYLQDGDTGATFMDFSADFPATALILSLGRYGTVFGGYKRDRLLDYDVRYQDPMGFTIHRFGLGGTYIIRGGYAYNFRDKVLLGLAAGRLYGKTKTGSFIEERPAAGSYLEPSRYQKEAFRTTLMEPGVTVRWRGFSLAAAASFALSRGEVVQEHQFIQNYPTDSVVAKQERTLALDFYPSSGLLGLAYAASKRLDLALDLYGVLWDQGGRHNEYRLSAGLEYRFTDRRSDKYFLNIPVRLGYYYHDYGYDDGVLTQALTAGFSLPTANHYGVIHVGVEGGRRYLESLSDSPLTETYSRISVQLVHKGRWGRLRRARTSAGRPAAPSPE